MPVSARNHVTGPAQVGSRFASPDLTPIYTLLRLVSGFAGGCVFMDGSPGKAALLICVGAFTPWVMRVCSAEPLADERHPVQAARIEHGREGRR